MIPLEEVWVLSNRRFTERRDDQQLMKRDAEDITELYHESSREEEWAGLLQYRYADREVYELEEDELTIHDAAGRPFTEWTPEYIYDDVDEHWGEYWALHWEEFITVETEWVEYPSFVEPASSIIRAYREGGDHFWLPRAIVSREKQVLPFKVRPAGVNITGVTFGEEEAIKMLEEHGDYAVVAMLWGE